MSDAAVTREQLHAYLDDALGEADTSRVEQALRGSEELRRQLQLAMAERDRGDHSLGAIWRRDRLTCPSREALGSYLLGALDEGEQAYLDFHLKAAGCPYCQANLADLQAQRQETGPQAKERQRRIFKTSAGHLRTTRD